MGEQGKPIGAVCVNGGTEEQKLSFEEILLDETLAAGRIWIKKEAIRKAGGINCRLHGKRIYELLLRVAREYTVVCGGQETEDSLKKDPEAWVCLESEECDTWSGVQTDCYLIGRYKDMLLGMGCFDEAVLGILGAGGEDAAAYLEKMIAGKEEYNWIYDGPRPILVYVGGDGICYGVLDAFAHNMGRALEEQGVAVEYCVLSQLSLEELNQYINRRFLAIVAMQTDMFSVKLNTGHFLHDYIDTPLYHFIFDHPILLKNYLQEMPGRECVLTPDGNYARFVESCYGHPARFFPPAGCTKFYWEEEKEYGISFLGSYNNELLERLIACRKKDKKSAHLISRFILRMRRHLEEPPEEAFAQTLKSYGIPYDRDLFLEQFYLAGWAIWNVAHYYRSKMVQMLLDEGIILHVFGESWKKSPMWGHPGLIWHEEVSGDEALRVYARSKLSLNIMTWHKDGFTERIANIMLQKSVVVTDKTTYLERNFEDGKELLLFDLAKPHGLAGRIRELLSDEERRVQMAEAGYRKAVREHTWKQRAKTMLEWIHKEGR